MKLKRDANGNVVCDANGMPVWIMANGDEVAYDVPSAVQKIGELTTEAKNHRLAKEAAEGKLAAFTGIEDPAAAIKALETLANLDSKKLIDAGEVDKVKKQVAEGYDAKIKTLTEAHALEVSGKDAHIYKLEVSNQFATSPFLNGDTAKIILPPDIAEATFGKHFKIEDQQVVAYIGDNKIYSKERPGELAKFDEAIAVIVDQYPMKERILKGSGGKGSGAEQKGQQGQRQDNTNLSSTQRIAAGLRELGQ